MQTMQKCKQPPFCPVRPDDIPSEKRKVRNSFEKEEIKQAERKGRCPRRHSPCRFGSICPSRENERNLNAKVWKSPYVRVCVSEMREDCRYTLLVARRDLFFPHISIVLSAVLGRITCSSHWKKKRPSSSSSFAGETSADDGSHNLLTLKFFMLLSYPFLLQHES